MGARTDAADLRGRVKDLRGALDLIADRSDPEVLATAGAALESASERLDLGVEHTVVALVGGTGSGKSSLFNAVSRLNFADVGVKRPTTSRMTACAWSDHADALLDWVGVDSDRRINRISALDDESERALDGLVLLDLPDHDSVRTENREVVDRVVPMADLLVWVVDPQKYADDALHSGYLQTLVGAEGSMLVVLNQLDTVPPTQRDEILADVSSLLTYDGLGVVDVLGVSAVTGDGVDELRTRLAKVVAARSVASVRVSSELTRAGTLVADALSSEAPRSLDGFVAPAVDALAVGVGLEARGRTAALTLDDGSAAAAGVAVTPEVTARVRTSWLDGVGRHLSAGWRENLERVVTPAEEIAVAVDRAVGDVRLEAGPGRAVRRARASAVVLGILAVIAAGAGLALLLGWWDLPDGVGTGTYLLVGAGVLALGVVVALLVHGRARRQHAAERESRFVSVARERLTEVVGELLLQPSSPVLRDHHDARVLALAAAEQSPTGS
jgi:GTP-binding protein EngB required for normal cell division